MEYLAQDSPVLSIATLAIIYGNFTRPVDNCSITWPPSLSHPITIQNGRVRKNWLSLCLTVLEMDH